MENSYLCFVCVNCTQHRNYSNLRQPRNKERTTGHSQSGDMHNQIQWCNSSPACHLFQYLSELRSTVALAIPKAPGLRPVQRQYELVRQSKQLFFSFFFGGTNFDDVTVQAVSQIAAVQGMGNSRKGCGMYCTRPELAMSSRISPILNLRLCDLQFPDFFFFKKKTYLGMRQTPFFCTGLQVCASSAGHLLVHSSLQMRAGD